ncbi:MAG: DUF222 domain-containing protein [Microthrixaceae bacterium]
MFQSPLERHVGEVESSLVAVVGSIDPDAVPASEATRLVERLDRIVRAASAARTLLARRMADSLEWQRKGFRSPEEHLAATVGTSLSAAKTDLATSEALRALPATRAGMLDGSLSAAQGSVIAGAASVNPAAEGDLIQKAGRTNLRELQEEAGRARAAADRDPEATHARLHRQRRVSRHTDGEGMVHLHAQGTPDEAAVVISELDRLADEIFHERRSTGVREARDTYVWDALVRMAQRSRDGSGTGSGSGTKRSRNPRHLGLLRIDVEALRRGQVEGDELCEITGVGPVPVRVARDLLGDAILKMVITNGVDVLNVTSLGRGPTAAMRTALLWTSPTCTVEGCSRTIIEHDHRTGAEFKDTLHARLDELDPVCTGHHDLHTHHGWALVHGKGKRAMVPPDDPRHPSRGSPSAAEAPEPSPVEIDRTPALAGFDAA